MKFLAWIEATDFSTWTRESDWALFAFLIVHTIGMGSLIGTAVATNLRILGFASRVPLAQFERFVPAMKYGLIAAVASGILLVISYPAKALTNPLFYIKLSIVTTALLVTRRIVKHFVAARPEISDVPSSAKKLAVFCILLWVSGLTAGKFLAYTYKILLVD
jgi:hypothetical protein